MLAVCYNGISGPGARGGAANYTTIRRFCQVDIMHKNRVEKFSTLFLFVNLLCQFFGTSKSLVDVI